MFKSLTRIVHVSPPLIGRLTVGSIVKNGMMRQSLWASFLINKRFGSDISNLKKESDKNEVDDSSSTTGVVDLSSSEILMYYDHIYSSTISKYRIKQYLAMLLPGKSHEELKAKVKALSTSEENPLPEEATILEFIPVRRDGGAFVKYQVPPGMTKKELTKIIVDNMKFHKITFDQNLFKRYYNQLVHTYPKCYEVKGTPWIEDLQRFPSSILSVKFEGSALTEEELYMLFRRYGRIIDIEPGSPSTIKFRYLRAAICAKNCITGISLDGGKTTLHLQYQPDLKVNKIGEFISNHQRIAIPIILAIIAGVAVLIFDPIRQFFIEEKIAHRFSLSTYRNNRYFKFIMAPILQVEKVFFSGYDYIGEKLNSECQKDVISNESDLDDDSSIEGDNLWNERYEKIKQLKLWILENVGTFIIINGPKGAGKKELVIDNTLMEDENLRKKILYLDVDAMVKSRSETKLIENVASQLGYFPVFGWLNLMSQFIDLGVQSFTGQKSGLSESKETQIKNMFTLASQAIKSVALSEYDSYKAEVMKKRTRQEHRLRANPDLDIKLEEVMKEDEYLQQHPEVKPIVVINKFSSKADNHDFIYKMISDWSASLIQSNLGHVVFITNDIGSLSHLNQALPNQVFKVLSLNDANEKGSYNYVMNQLKDLTRYEKFDSSLISKCLKPLGGRMLDLQSFIRRVRSGESPQEALDELVNQAVEQITNFFLHNLTTKDDTNFKNWSPTEVWELIKFLSNSDSISFNELTSKSSLFKNDNSSLEVLSSLEKNDLITLKREKGVIHHITTGRPIYKAAFKNIIEDEEIFRGFESNFLSNLISVETTKLKKYEAELSSVDFVQLNIKNRMKYLIDGIEASNEKIIGYEAKVKELKTKKKEEPFWKIV